MRLPHAILPALALAALALADARWPASSDPAPSAAVRAPVPAAAGGPGSPERSASPAQPGPRRRAVVASGAVGPKARGPAAACDEELEERAGPFDEEGLSAVCAPAPPPGYAELLERWRGAGYAERGALVAELGGARDLAGLLVLVEAFEAGDAALAPELLRALAGLECTEREERLVAGGVERLASKADATVVPVLHGLLDCELERVRRAAIAALARRGELTPLERQLAAAARGLGELEAGEVEAGRVMRALEELAAPRSALAVPHLLPLLESDSPEVRVRTVEILAALPGEQGRAGIERVLHDPVLHVRQLAAAALGVPVPDVGPAPESEEEL